MRMYVSQWIEAIVLGCLLEHLNCNKYKHGQAVAGTCTQQMEELSPHFFAASNLEIVASLCCYAINVCR